MNSATPAADEVAARSESLRLADIYLGNIDAKNEVLNNTPEETLRFFEAYVVPPALTIDRFQEKNQYFIVGLKGTGKTALLRYVSIKLEDDDTSISRFVLFKSDIDEESRRHFSGAARIQVVEENSEDYEGDDFEAVWRWFVYKKIAQAIKEDNAHIFQRNADLAEFVSIVSVEANRLGHPTVSLIPHIRKGSIEISKSPKLNLDLSWDSNGKAKVKFSELVNRADALFKSLLPEDIRLNLFFDELELNYSTSKQYQRDSRLVRDLIVTIEKVNALAKERAFNLCLYAAVRSEVVNSVQSLGKEINKPLTDFGSKIVWNRAGIDAARQPLLGIIERRINNARRGKGLMELESAEVWSTYFPEAVHEQHPQAYILHNSWYRPRDVVRLLRAAQEQYPDSLKFDVQALEAVRKEYSSASWVELTEELKTKYKAREIDGIKYLLYGGLGIWSIDGLRQRVAAASEDHVEVKDLVDSHPFKDVLKDLFRVGIIGNIEQRSNRTDRRMRFSFRGDDEILFDYDIYVHKALRAHLSITRDHARKNVDAGVKK